MHLDLGGMTFTVPDDEVHFPVLTVERVVSRVPLLVTDSWSSDTFPRQA